jgi:membrane protein insertase Oxa1/YidC/SpoIIIJ
MEIEATLLWNLVLTLVILPFGWAFSKMFAEVKRLQILLNKTREEYSTKEDLRDTSSRVMEALHRLEDKLDKVLSK